MKSKIAIFSALLCMLGFAANASDCIGEGCFIEDLNQINQRIDRLEQPAPADTYADPSLYGAPPGQMQAAPSMPALYQYAQNPVQFRNVKAISVKPVVPDDRPPVWDGVHGPFQPRNAAKTVDSWDGVPLWDDSIVNHRTKDFRDWFLEPMDEIYMGEMPPQDQPDIEVRNQVNGLLAPNRPKCDLWTKGNCETINHNSEIINPVSATAETADGCPFETDKECDIWRKKPMVRETVAPRSPQIRAVKMDAFLAAACADPRITANNPDAAPLLDRYGMLMRASRACCTDGMVDRLRRAGASDGLIYKFLVDDANFYQFGSRCLVMSNSDLDTSFPNTVTATVASDVRNGCLCRRRQWFAAMLAPFNEAYAASPEFADSKFNFTFTDGLQRRITVSVNNDVKNVLDQLSRCP